jgi:hypothetical protein
VFGTRARRLVAIPLGLAAALVVEDVLVCGIAGAPSKAWGVVALSPMRLGFFFAAACILIAATWICAAGIPRRWPSRLTLFSLALLGLFLGNGRYIGSNDIAATRLVPFVLGREGRLSFEHSPNVPLDPSALPYWFVPAGEHIVSRYPVATGVLALPAYVPALAGSYDPTRERVHELERIAAAALALFSVLIIAAIARRLLAASSVGAAPASDDLHEATLTTRDDARTALVRDRTDGTALLIAGIYALCTPVATVLSKALWQHSGGAFGFSLALAGLFLARRACSRQLLVGLGLGIAIAARTTNAAPAAFVWLASLAAFGPRTALLSGLFALAPVAAHLAYSRFYFGSLLATGYGREAIDGWTGTGWLGLLISPGRGLMLYAPCLAFAAVALFRERELIDRRVSLLLAGAVAALLLVMGRWWCWWGGGSPGERMLSDVAPLWGVGLALAWKRFGEASPTLRRAWFLSCAYACAVHTLITFVRPGGFVTEQFFRVMSGPWAWHAYAPVTYLIGLFSR